MRIRKCSGLLVLLTIFTAIEARKVVKCSEFCFCDEYENLKRATCSHKKLISVEVDLPPQAEILDLSHNLVSELTDKIFIETNLTNLKLLNLSHNKVSQIHFNGFKGLTNLKTLDLSHNALRYLLKSWFDTLTSLEELYLRANNLRSINEEPDISLGSLRVLDLSRCGITHLKPKVFIKLPNVHRLDISGNYLTFLSTEVLKPLRKLSFLSLHDNNFSCNEHVVVKLRNYAKHKGITYKDPCPETKEKLITNRKNVKFEKMIMKVEDEIEPQGKNEWILEDDKDKYFETSKMIEICSNFNNTSNVTSEHESPGLLMEIISLNPWLVMLVTLIYGVMIGLVIGCTVQIRPKKPKPDDEVDFPDGSAVFLNNGTSRANSSSGINKNTNNRNSTANFNSFRPRSTSAGTSRLSRSFSRPRGCEGESLMNSEYDLANSTPVTPRKLYQ